METCSMNVNMFTKGSIVWTLVVLLAIGLGLVLDFLDWSAKCESY